MRTPCLPLAQYDGIPVRPAAPAPSLPGRVPPAPIPRANPKRWACGLARGRDADFGHALAHHWVGGRARVWMAGPHPSPQGPNQMALLGAASRSSDQGIGWNRVQPTARSRSTAVAERHAPRHTLRPNTPSPPTWPPCLPQPRTACTMTMPSLCSVPNARFLSAASQVISGTLS